MTSNSQFKKLLNHTCNGSNMNPRPAVALYRSRYIYHYLIAAILFITRVNATQCTHSRSPMTHLAGAGVWHLSPRFLTTTCKYVLTQSAVYSALYISSHLRGQFDSKEISRVGPGLFCIPANSSKEAIVPAVNTAGHSVLKNDCPQMSSACLDRPDGLL